MHVLIYIYAFIKEIIEALCLLDKYKHKANYYKSNLRYTFQPAGRARLRGLICTHSNS